ncbi:MAG: histidine phosphatase family protein [Candidatus Sericytochromatia bacterium]
MLPTERFVLLIRHAEAEPDQGDISDSERGLTAKGLHQIHVQGERLAQAWHPQQLFASHAVRSRDTAQRLAPFWALPVESVIQETLLYEAQGADELLLWLRGQNDTTHCLALVGHNPLLNWLLEMLTACPSDNFPKGAVAGLRLPCASWGELQAGSAELCFFYLPTQTPSKLRKADLERRLNQQIWQLLQGFESLERPDNVREAVSKQVEKLAKKLDPLLPSLPLRPLPEYIQPFPMPQKARRRKKS